MSNTQSPARDLDAPATFGARVLAARRAQGFDRERLATKLGVTPKTIAGWEADRAMPRSNKTQMLAAMLNVSLRWLLSGRSELESEGITVPLSDNESNQSIRTILSEMRDLKSELTDSAQKLTRLERRLQAAL
ncbi:MAG: helix-turn-helix domain-containing protein [Alphaproteobacteria bacterium]|nr:helix-turn-helix domain-containing protein [Alphaproteobacteria bacterium]